MSGITELVELLNKGFNKRAVSGLVLAKVTSVDWNAKTLEAKGIIDDLPYYDVSLGLGALYVKPKTNSNVLLLNMQGNDAITYLIAAEEADEVIFNDGNNGGIVLSKKLSDRLNELESALTEIQAVFNAHVHANNGAATLTQLTYQVPQSQKGDFENAKIKH